MAVATALAVSQHCSRRALIPTLRRRFNSRQLESQVSSIGAKQFPNRSNVPNLSHADHGKPGSTTTSEDPGDTDGQFSVIVVDVQIVTPRNDVSSKDVMLFEDDHNEECDPVCAQSSANVTAKERVGRPLTSQDGQEVGQDQAEVFSTADGGDG